MAHSSGLADRVAGTILGAAIGDALGHPTEFLNRDQIVHRFGAKGVRGFELWWERDGRRFAPYTDDTQLAVVVLEALLDHYEHGGGEWWAVMPAIAARVAEWAEAPRGGHRAPGNACLAAARRLRLGIPWDQAGDPEAGGCGSVMRAYPFGLVFGRDMAHATALAVEHSRMTHGHPIALAACAAIAAAVGSAVHLHSPEFSRRWLTEAAARWDNVTAEMIATAREAGSRRTDPAPYLDRWRGWAAHEAIAAAVFCASYYPDDFAEGVLLGANAPGDSDSIASLTGALLGARLGVSAIPSDWVRDVEDSEELLGLAARVTEMVGNPERLH